MQRVARRAEEQTANRQLISDSPDDERLSPSSPESSVDGHDGPRFDESDLIPTNGLHRVGDLSLRVPKPWAS